MPKWSKGVDSSSTSASCVVSDPTGVNFKKRGLHEVARSHRVQEDFRASSSPEGTRSV